MAKEISLEGYFYIAKIQIYSTKEEITVKLPPDCFGQFEYNKKIGIINKQEFAAKEYSDGSTINTFSNKDEDKNIKTGTITIYNKSIRGTYIDVPIGNEDGYSIFRFTFSEDEDEINNSLKSIGTKFDRFFTKEGDIFYLRESKYDENTSNFTGLVAALKDTYLIGIDILSDDGYKGITDDKLFSFERIECVKNRKHKNV
ncbi:MAG: hypothetical protein K5765_03225 [Clostridia bacterium]|nr:hypothetical protein [Clostridia bacterium]